MGASKGRRRHGELVVTADLLGPYSDRVMLEIDDNHYQYVCRYDVETLVGRKLEPGKTYRVRLRGTVLEEL